MRDQSSLSSRLLDLLCVAVLGLLLTFLAGVIARATGPASAAAAAQAAADCDTPAKPEAPVKAGETALAGGLPSSMSVGACADGSDKPAAAAADAAQPHH